MGEQSGACFQAVPPNVSFLLGPLENINRVDGGEDEDENEVRGRALAPRQGVGPRQGLGPKNLHPGWDFLHNHADDDDEEDNRNNNDQRVVTETSLPNDDAMGIESTFDDSMRATSHQSRLNELKNPPPIWKQSTMFQKNFKCDFDGFTITGKVDIISAILGKLTQVTISNFPGKGKQTTNTMLLVASSCYYIFVHENFKEDIIAKINKIRGVPHPHSANKHALLRKNITMVTPQFVQVLQDVLVDSVTIVGFAQKAPVAWGQKLMQAARGADSNCTCEFDMAAQIPPEKCIGEDMMITTWHQCNLITKESIKKTHYSAW